MMHSERRTVSTASTSRAIDSYAVQNDHDAMLDVTVCNVYKKRAMDDIVQCMLSLHGIANAKKEFVSLNAHEDGNAARATVLKSLTQYARATNKDLMKALEQVEVEQMSHKQRIAEIRDMLQRYRDPPVYFQRDSPPKVSAILPSLRFIMSIQPEGENHSYYYTLLLILQDAPTVAAAPSSPEKTSESGTVAEDVRLTKVAAWIYEHHIVEYDLFMELYKTLDTISVVECAFQIDSFKAVVLPLIYALMNVIQPQHRRKFLTMLLQNEDYDHVEFRSIVEAIVFPSAFKMARDYIREDAAERHPPPDPRGDLTKRSHSLGAADPQQDRKRTRRSPESSESQAPQPSAPNCFASVIYICKAFIQVCRNLRFSGKDARSASADLILTINRDIIEHQPRFDVDIIDTSAWRVRIIDEFEKLMVSYKWYKQNENASYDELTKMYAQFRKNSYQLDLLTMDTRKKYIELASMVDNILQNDLQRLFASLGETQRVTSDIIDAFDRIMFTYAQKHAVKNKAYNHIITMYTLFSKKKARAKDDPNILRNLFSKWNIEQYLLHSFHLNTDLHKHMRNIFNMYTMPQWTADSLPFVQQDFEQRRDQEEAQRKAQEEERARQKEAQIKAQEEAQRKAQEALRKAQEEERARQKEARRKAQEEALRKAQEERARQEEARIKAQEEALRKAQEERARQEEARIKAQEDAQIRAQAEERARAEAENARFVKDNDRISARKRALVDAKTKHIHNDWMKRVRKNRRDAFHRLRQMKSGDKK